MEDPHCAPDLTRYQDCVALTTDWNLGPAAARFLRLPFTRVLVAQNCPGLGLAYHDPPTLDSCDPAFPSLS